MSWWGRFFYSLLLLSSLISGSIVVSGCSSDSSGSNTQAVPTFDTTNTLKKEMESASLYCANKECESNKSDFESIGLVGMVVEGTVDSYWRKMSQCTGFLYGSNDIVALNSHCISDSMWQQKNNCGGVLAIKFPDVDGKPSEVRNCLEIIYRSNIETIMKFNVNTDYAFFRIAPIDRTPLPLSTTGAPNNQSITVRKVNPLASFNTLGGNLDYAQCQTQTESFLNVDYLDTWSPTGLGLRTSNTSKTCKIIKGNSGSPVLNARNEIIGIAQSYWMPEYLKQLNSTEFQEAYSKVIKIKVELDFPYYIPDHFHFTQTACLLNPRHIQSENTYCKLRLSAQKTGEQILLSNFENTRSINDYAEKLKAETLASHPAFFKYEFVKEDNRQAYSIRPQCLLNSQKWSPLAIDAYRSNTRTTPKSLRTYAKPSLIELKVTAKFNDDFVVSTKKISHSTVNTTQYLTSISETNQLSVYKTTCTTCLSTEDNLEKVENINWCQ